MRTSGDRQRRCIDGLMVAITCAYRWGRDFETGGGQVLLDVYLDVDKYDIAVGDSLERGI